MVYELLKLLSFLRDMSYSQGSTLNSPYNYRWCWTSDPCLHLPSATLQSWVTPSFLWCQDWILLGKHSHLSRIVFAKVSSEVSLSSKGKLGQEHPLSHWALAPLLAPLLYPHSHTKLTLYLKPCPTPSPAGRGTCSRAWTWMWTFGADLVYH